MAWTYSALVSAAMIAHGVFNAAVLWRTDWRHSAASARRR
jgi:hypothetical protein